MNPIIEGLVTTIFLLIICCGQAFAEKTVVTAEGKYVMGDLDTKQNAKTLALMEAKRMSLEKAGTYIESISQVKDYQLTKDEINSLAAGVMSVEILKEDWKMSGENMVLVLSVRATIDTSNLKSRISAMQEGQGSENYKEIQMQMASLQKELADLKAQQSVMKDKSTPKPELKEKNEGIIKKMSALEYLEEGNAALRVQRWKDAIEAYERALAVDPKLADAYAGMSLALKWEGQAAKAREAVETALKLDPNSAIGRSAMAKIMFDEGKYDKALESINKAIELRPMFPNFYIARGDTYLKLRKGELAIRDFLKACEMGRPRACHRADMIKERMPGKKRPR